jgi:energy-coupling factor transporter ATP-binding protein EcfA2
MYVTGTIIRNFRSLQRVTIKFGPGLNVLVGKNNAGKSNIIRALDYVLGETWPTYRKIEHKDFYLDRSDGDPASSFLIMCGLGGQTINVDLLRTIKSNVALYELPQGPNWNDIDYFLEEFCKENTSREWLSYRELGERLCRAERLYLFLAVPREGRRRERVYGIVLRVGRRWFGVPRFAGDLRDALLTTAYVPSFRDPGYQLRVTEYSWYGKLVRHLYEQKTEAQATEISEAQIKQADVLADIFQDATCQLQRQLESAVFHHSISFVPGANTRDDEYKQITLYVDDGLNTPFYEKGSGIQSALVVGLFSLYCSLFHKGSSLLLAEEPELYLHPQARRAIEAQLVRFVEDGRDGNEGQGENMHQIIMSTHSPEFLRSVSLDDVVLVKRPRGQIETEIVVTEQTLPRATQVLQTKNAELVFADCVILVEGGEEYIIPPLADVLFGEKSWLDIHNVSVVRVNGKGSFLTYVQLLDELQIPWVILTDLDFLLDEVSKFQELLDESAWTEIGRVREQLKAYGELPKGKKIKQHFSPQTRDWTSLYHAVQGVVLDLVAGERLSEERLDEIRSLWSQLEDRVSRSDHRAFLNEFQEEQLFSQALSALREVKIFVLSRGELEDCLTEEAMNLGHTKDTRALEVGGELLDCTNLEEAEQWLITDDFVLMLGRVQRELEERQPRRVRQNESIHLLD